MIIQKDERKVKVLAGQVWNTGQAKPSPVEQLKNALRSVTLDQMETSENSLWAQTAVYGDKFPVA